MRLLATSFVLSLSLLAGCVGEFDEGNGVITHSEHQLTSEQAQKVTQGMSQYLKRPVIATVVDSSTEHATNNAIVCGYVSVVGSNIPPAIFAGMLSDYGRGAFTPYRVPGAGQDPARIAGVRSICQSHKIRI